MNNKKRVIISLIILAILVFVLGIHGGSEYYFRDFCVHKTLNMFYHYGSPEFFKKPNLISDIEFFAYGGFYSILKLFSVVGNFDDFVRLFTLEEIPTKFGNISFMLPALIINNVFAVIGVVYTFLLSYEITEKKVLPSFLSAFLLATSYIWMNFSHHLAVDLPLAALCLVTVYYSVYFIKRNSAYSLKHIVILGILTGLSASVKYNGLLVLTAPLSVILLTETSKKECLKKILGLLFCAFYAFIITNPYILFKASFFLSDYTYEFDHAFEVGHAAADDYNAFKFHLFHSFPNVFGLFLYFVSVFGAGLIFKNEKFSKNIKYALLSFPVVFFIVLSFSLLVFFRYILPLVPFIAVFIGFAVNYLFEKFSMNKFAKMIIVVISFSVIIFGSVNVFNFWKITSRSDVRVTVKKILNQMGVNETTRIIHSEVFSNPYYEWDFTNKYPNLKLNIVEFLYNANNSSINIVPRFDWNLFSDYDIIIFDSYSFDKHIQVRKDSKYASIDNQYVMYFPHRDRIFYINNSESPFYVAVVNPYRKQKSEVPFDILRSDWKYRTYRGPYVEIYFRQKRSRDEFVQKCSEYKLNCSAVSIENSYYQVNILNKSIY